MTAISPALPNTYFTIPYLTVAEYKAAPTGVDIKGLIPGATPAARDAELANIISRATGYCNQACHQNLAATVDVEQGRVRISRNGEIFIQTHCWPILEVRSLLLGSMPSNMTAQDFTDIFIEHSSFTVLQTSLGLTSSEGPLQFAALQPMGSGFARWTYVNGWPISLTVGTNNAAATTLNLVSALGVHTGMSITIYDAERTESVLVTGEPTGGAVPCSALQFSHVAGLSASALPPAVKQAAIQMTSGLIRLKGDEALVMRAISQSEPQKTKADEAGVKDITDAVWALQPFRTVR